MYFVWCFPAIIRNCWAYCRFVLLSFFTKPIFPDCSLTLIIIFFTLVTSVISSANSRLWFRYTMLELLIFVLHSSSQSIDKQNWWKRDSLSVALTWFLVSCKVNPIILPPTVLIWCILAILSYTPQTQSVFSIPRSYLSTWISLMVNIWSITSNTYLVLLYFSITVSLCFKYMARTYCLPFYGFLPDFFCPTFR